MELYEGYWTYITTLGRHMMLHLYLMAVLCASFSCPGPVPKGFVVLVSSPISVHYGDTITLPCWLNPAQSAEDLEVRWYRGDHFDTPIILYQIQHQSIDDSYTGRVFFDLKDAASGGLRTGDVSLKLFNVTMEDAGDYTCYVSSDQGYDHGSVSLNVTKTGSAPLLSVVWMGENLVNVSCESEGWHPQPRLRWSDHKRELTPKSLQYSSVQRAFSLLSVHSWLLVSGSADISCSVGVSDEEVKEASLHLQAIPPQLYKSVAGWVAFTLLLIAMLVLLGGLYFRNTACRKKKKSKKYEAEETKELLPAVSQQPTVLAEAKTHYENIALEEKEHPHLKIKDWLLRDNINPTSPEGQEVTCLTAIKGAPAFSSGKHYWEVLMGRDGVPLKRSWWVGVTNAAGFPRECNLPPTASSGFWFLSSSRNRADSLQVSSEPTVLLPIHSLPQRVGVYLNYDSGELSFYDVEKNHIIVSLAAMFTGEIFPLFNPGEGDASSMEILQTTTQGE